MYYLNTHMVTAARLALATLLALSSLLMLAAPALAVDPPDELTGQGEPTEEELDDAQDFSAEATAEQRGAAAVAPSIVYIDIFWEAWVFDGEDWLNDGYPFELRLRCSGFVVNSDGYIATAGHCVDPAEARMLAITHGVAEWLRNGWIEPGEERMLLEHAAMNWLVYGWTEGSPPDREVYVQHGKAVSGLTTGEVWTARVLDYAGYDDGDVALLKIETSDLTAAVLAPDSAVQIGLPVLSVGYPGSRDLVVDQSLDPTYKDGRISSKTTRGGGKLPVYEISAAVSGGMSGGPTVDTQGGVVGVNSFNIVGEPQQFNFVSPSSLLQEMLARHGVSNEPGDVGEAYLRGLDAFFEGDFEAAIEHFDEVLAISPAHRQAQDFRKQAHEMLRLHGPAPVNDGEEPGTEEGPSAGGEADQGAAEVLLDQLERQAQMPVALASDETVATVEDEGGQGAPVALIATVIISILVAAGSMVTLGLRTRSRHRTGREEPTDDVQPHQGEAPPHTTAPEPVAVTAPPAASNGQAEAPAHAVQAVLTLEPTGRFCPQCGRQPAPSARFCDHCGHGLN